MINANLPHYIKIIRIDAVFNRSLLCDKRAAVRPRNALLRVKCCDLSRTLIRFDSIFVKLGYSF